MKYTAGEVLAMAKMVGDEFSPHAGWMLNAFAERIKADEGAVPFGYAYRYADGIKLGGSGRERNGMRPTETIPLFAHPPAQAAHVDPAAKPHTLADFVHATGAERAQIGQQVATRVDEMMAEPVAQAAPVVDLHDRIEFALRDAGFGLDEASTLAERATAEPATHGESGVIRHVGDSRFESWFSEYVVGQNGAKQQARDAYGAGLAEQAERLAAQPAQSVDVAKVREVIVWLRSGSMAITANAGIAADKLEAALQEKGNG